MATLTFLKNDRKKVSLDRVPSLAKALEVDPVNQIILALDPTVSAAAAKAIIETFGMPTIEYERGWLNELRNAFDTSQPRLAARSPAALRGIFGKQVRQDTMVMMLV